MLRSWVRISFLFLLSVAVIGTLLRAFPYLRLNWNYTHLLHAHSHIGFQGWIYTMILLLIPALYLNPFQVKKSRYSLQFRITIPLIILIMIAFVIQGYALYSILFSTLFQFLNYRFFWSFIRDSNRYYSQSPPYSLRWIKAGMWLGLLSTFAPYAIGIISAKGLSGSELYHSVIYGFLHFQYNGWFLFTAIGLFFRVLELNNVSFNIKYALIFYWLNVVAVIPAYALSLLGMSFKELIYPFAVFAGLTEIIGLYYLIMSFKSTSIKSLLNNQLSYLLIVMLVCYFIKILAQGLSLIPNLQIYASSNRFIIIAFIHLSLIGVISFLFLYILLRLEWMISSIVTQVGTSCLLVGFVLTESILLLVGFGFGFYPKTLMVFSGLMGLGVLLLTMSSFKEERF
ncbi:hypothetical protein [Reichenbachiella versicolor]|uniref:hypothetical protein n=1 Tax=Reichenbachiella versicolor TaxID=1821036 RepID=UPI000D6E0A35|nr:hypothetical protein [Reichenbachiella versicolor]